MYSNAQINVIRLYAVEGESKRNLESPSLGWANIRHIFLIRIMNIFDLLFEYFE
jgi:hypothetical protein